MLGLLILDSSCNKVKKRQRGWGGEGKPRSLRPQAWISTPCVIGETHFPHKFSLTSCYEGRGLYSAVGEMLTSPLCPPPASSSTVSLYGGTKRAQFEVVLLCLKYKGSALMDHEFKKCRCALEEKGSLISSEESVKIKRLQEETHVIFANKNSI